MKPARAETPHELKPEKSRRKGLPPWKGHPNHRTPKQGSTRDDPTKEQKKRAPHDCQRMTSKSGHRDIRQRKTKRAPHDCQRMTSKSGHRDIRQRKTQNETPQKKPNTGTNRLCQDQAAEPEQGRRLEEL